MKTAMQEHIDWLKSALEICKEHATPLINCLKLCISDAESKLEMEKNEIKDAFNQGYREAEFNSNAIVNKGDIAEFSDANKYYNKTFK